tara:strand:+ start:121 stop:288 length:168 start_codon:yes stop_codon:yes gene_type:complete
MFGINTERLNDHLPFRGSLPDMVQQYLFPYKANPILTKVSKIEKDNLKGAEKSCQ